ncbi:hypothetical protein [Streptomyces sp. NPDC058739]|uniref:hypothetical protein n=1 Tax=Streptomyces sp. NPDC058739 TaxID=3346618 RepID=UPI0036C9A9AF
MARLVRQQRVHAFVGYFSFGRQESDDADLPVPFPDDFHSDGFLGTHPGRLDITSGGHTHTATVDVEVWDGVPPAQALAAWDEQAEADLETTSGRIAVWSMHTGRMDEVITLAEPGRSSWRVRVHCAGRAEAAALSEDAGTGVGAERYLFQFWPASRSACDSV